MTAETPIYIASITKLYTAAVVMRLYEQQLLSLDDPISRYLPIELVQGLQTYGGADHTREVTIAQLLSHSSGIPDYYDEAPDGTKTLFQIFIEDPGRQWSVDQAIGAARRLKSRFPPGKGTSYSDTNYQLLGKAIEAVTKQSLHTVFDEYLFRPLNLRATWLVGFGQSAGPVPADIFYKEADITNTRSNGAYWADGGIVSTTREMIVFLKALHDGRIVGPRTLALMHRWRKWRFPLEYGLGTMHFGPPWPISALVHPAPLWGHSGSTGSFLYYSESADVYVAGTIDQVDARRKAFMLMLKALAAIR